MRDYALIDWEPRLGKATGAFTTYLLEYGSPCILMSYMEDEYSMITLIHEFGHLNDYLLMGAPPETLDVAEIYSQGLELLVANRWDEFLGADTGYMLRYNTLLDKASSFVLQGYFSAIELEVYSLAPEAAA